jgi:nucleoside-diphosphate-sugar epimerase
LKILVTGGAGYIGSVLCEHLLNAGHQVHVLDTMRYSQLSLFHLASNERFDFTYGDARDVSTLRPLVAEADVLIPLAAVVGAPACDQQPELATSLNYGAVATLNRLRGRQQLVVYPTTNSGYGTKSGATFCTEETPLEPISLYGRTKCEAESLLLDSPNTITLRLATVFGLSPRMRLDLMVNHFVHAAVNEGSLVLFEKDFMRNFLHIRDGADCFVHCIEHAESMVGQPYNVGRDEENMSKWDLALRIKRHVPHLYIHAAEVGTDPDKRNYVVSNQRLRDAGFVAERSLDDGIRELLIGFRMLRGGVFRNT